MRNPDSRTNVLNKKRLLIVAAACGFLMTALMLLTDLVLEGKVSDGALRIIRPVIVFAALLAALRPSLAWVLREEERER